MMKIGGTLYKVDSKGKVRVWEIHTAELSGVPFYSVSHGQLNGQMQETLVTVSEGKNIGRANETTAAEQCRAEAEALYTKQIERKGYSTAVPQKPPALPMLAHKYSDYAHKIQWPAIASVKIDGIRVIIDIKDGVAKCTSRTGTEIVNLDHITDDLVALGIDITLDGELYSDDLSFNEIVSVVRKTKSKDERMYKIFFYAFDIVDDSTYHERVVALDLLLVGIKNSRVVPWKIVKTEEDLFKLHKENVKNGQEGTMIRNLASLYQPNKRSYDLLKLKEFIDEEFEITGYKTGKGKFKYIPTFSLVTKDKKTFEAVPKGTEQERLQYLANADSYIGLMATVRYFEITEDGVPRFPVMVAIRNYE
jgi:DNA ligase-1